MGFINTLTLILIVLKLMDIITLSWGLVLTPMLVSGGISLFILIIQVFGSGRKGRKNDN